jgi:hypothetical protein
VQHTSELGKPSRPRSGWDIFAKGNGRENGKNKTELKGFPRQEKRYADKHRNHREFKVGDHVFLKVKSRKSSLKLGNCSKLATRYCGSFEILERIGPAVYMLALPASTCICTVFHVSLLKTYVHDDNHVID